MRRTTYLTGAVALVLLTLLAVSGAADPKEKAPPKVDPRAVNRAIERGVAFLKQEQNDKEGTWVYAGEGKTQGTLSVGMTALAALTLLHCDVPATDPAVQKAARFLRAAFTARLRDANQGRDVDTTYERLTYSAALTIVLLDNLGQASDTALIRVLTTWLLQTQDSRTGSWGYGTTLSPSHRDSSNTQFALLGLWAGSRHGVRITVPLARTTARFYLTHDEDGGWSYSPEEGDKSSSVAMSCAGLLALAFRHAAANEDVLRPRAAGSGPTRALSNVAQDPHVVRGFQYLQQKLKSAFAEGVSWKGDSPTYDNAYYALWSLERVAVAYDLRTIGDVDWYAEGASFLIAKQLDDGRWQGSWDLADTCFALLFLRRANLVPEATRFLQGTIAQDGKPAPSSSISPSPFTPTALEKSLKPAPVLQPVAKEKPKPPSNPTIEGMLHKLLDASPPEQEMLLNRWRDGEDETVMLVLAKAIARLSGAAQRKVRAALADRCTRLTIHQRDEYLDSDDAEIRRAAVVSCAVRDDRQHLDRLIELLQDNELTVDNAVHAVLCSLTGEDFGPVSPSTEEQRAAAVKAWRSWWQRQGKK
jgi:hypothetical protein